jgi:hypothetical protein
MAGGYEGYIDGRPVGGHLERLLDESWVRLGCRQELPSGCPAYGLGGQCTARNFAVVYGRGGLMPTDIRAACGQDGAVDELFGFKFGDGSPPPPSADEPS